MTQPSGIGCMLAMAPSTGENDYAEGIMAIGWDNMGDLMQYSSKEEMRAKMREVYGGTSSYKNQVHATWQFANDIKPGDIIFVKKEERNHW